jgi:lipopolysaccharide biosynthesis regulator YciM
MLCAVVLLLAMADSPLRLGLQALERKDFAVAVAQLEQASKATPQDPNVWILLAQARFGAGDSSGGVGAAERAETAGKGNADVDHGLAFLYAEFARDYAKAAAFETRYAKARPADTAAWGRVASLYIQAGMPERAIDASLLLYRANRNPESRALVEDSYFRVAQGQLVKQNFDGAVATLEKGRQILKDSAQLELALGVALYGKRKFPEAVGQFLRTMQLAPDVEQPYLFVGKVLEHAGDRMPGLIEQFRAYQRRHPESHLGYLLEAKSLVSQGGDTDRALDLVKQAVAKKDDAPEAQFLLGTLLEGKGDLAGAATALERSIALQNADAPAHYRLARVYLKLGRKEDAARERSLYEKLSQENGDAPK